MRGVTVTAVLAVWGAMLSSLVLVWDIYKWKTSGRPKLEISVSKPLTSLDPRETRRFINVRVTNVGDRPTTITTLTSRHFRTKPSWLRRQKPSIGIINTFHAVPPVLPHKLDIGEEWSYAFPVTPELEKKVAEGYFFVAIEDSTTRHINKAPKALVEIN